jgi:hypothetical protein
MFISLYKICTHFSDTHHANVHEMSGAAIRFILPFDTTYTSHIIYTPKPGRVATQTCNIFPVEKTEIKRSKETHTRRSWYVPQRICCVFISSFGVSSNNLLFNQGSRIMPIRKFRTDLASDSLVVPNPLGQRFYKSLQFWVLYCCPSFLDVESTSFVILWSLRQSVSLSIACSFLCSSVCSPRSPPPTYGQNLICDVSSSLWSS